MRAIKREIAMQKTFRKLVFLPVLLIAFAALMGMPQPAAATCDIQSDACPEGYLDCCCGSFQSCLGGINAAQVCAQSCGHWA